MWRGRRLPHYSTRTHFLVKKFRAHLNDSLFVQIRCSQRYVSLWSTVCQLSELMPVATVLQWHGVFPKRQDLGLLQAWLWKQLQHRNTCAVGIAQALEYWSITKACISKTWFYTIDSGDRFRVTSHEAPKTEGSWVATQKSIHSKAERWSSWILKFPQPSMAENQEGKIAL